MDCSSKVFYHGKINLNYFLDAQAGNGLSGMQVLMNILMDLVTCQMEITGLV